MQTESSGTLFQENYYILLKEQHLIVPRKRGNQFFFKYTSLTDSERTGSQSQFTVAVLNYRKCFLKQILSSDGLKLLKPEV